MAKEDNVLTEDFLFELYYACFTYDYVCNLVCEYMQKSYLPGRDFPGNKFIDDYHLSAAKRGRRLLFKHFRVGDGNSSGLCAFGNLPFCSDFSVPSEAFAGVHKKDL